MKNTRRFAANKLVRDGTPQKLGNQGITVHTRMLNAIEYDVELRSKLLEEADEVMRAFSQQELITRLADVLEVVRGLCELHNIELEDLERARQQSREARGGFDGRVYISQFEMAEDNESVNYYLSQPHKYPEV